MMKSVMDEICRIMDSAASEAAAFEARSAVARLTGIKAIDRDPDVLYKIADVWKRAKREGIKFSEAFCRV